MEEERILLSELLGEAGYRIEGIRLIARRQVFIASVRFGKGGHEGTLFVYPSRLAREGELFTDTVFRDAFLEKRTCGDTSEAYYCWDELLNGIAIPRFSVSGDVYIPSEPFGNIVSYPSVLVNGGLIMPPEERFRMLTESLTLDK